MKGKFIVVLILISSFFFAKCKPTEELSKTDQITKIKEEIFKDSEVEVNYNSTKTKVLLYKLDLNINTPATKIDYIVYDFQKRKMIYKDSFAGSKIEWNDNTSLKIHSYVGIEKKPTSNDPTKINKDGNKNFIIIQLKENR